MRRQVRSIARSNPAIGPAVGLRSSIEQFVAGAHSRCATVTSKHPILTLTAITVVSWLIVVLPLCKDFSVMYRYWDGPMYIAVSKTFYRIPLDNPIGQAYVWSPQRFAPFLLMYPLAIRLVAPLLGYHWGMIALAVVFSASATAVFYVLLRDLRLSDNPLGLSILSLFVPYRWLIYRSVGASEPMFLTFLLLSLLLFAKRKYAVSFLAAAIACDTRVQGVFLIPAYWLMLWLDRGLSARRKGVLLLGVLVIPGLLFLNCVLHYLAFGDFGAYLAVNSGMVHLRPFGQLVDYARNAVSLEGYFAAQLYLLLYTITLIGLVKLWGIDRRKVIFVYCLMVFVFLTFISHEDLSRFLIPIGSFTWVLGFKEMWKGRKMVWAFLVLLVLTCLYSWNLISLNVIDPTVASELLQWKP